MRTAWTHEGSGGGAEKQLLEEEPDQSKLRLEELSPENSCEYEFSMLFSQSMCLFLYQHCNILLLKLLTIISGKLSYSL